MFEEREYVRIGIITGLHGLDGRLKVKVTTDNPDRFWDEDGIFLEKGGVYKQYRVVDFHYVNGKPGVLNLKGIDTPEQGRLLKGREIYIDRDVAEATRSDLGSDEWYYYDLIGCNVIYNGADFGAVADILEAGTGEVLVIEDHSGKNHMVPFVESMVDTSELFEKRRITITPVEGLIEL